MLLHGQVEVNRRGIAEVRIPAFQPSIEIQHSGFSVFHTDAQQRVLKVVQRLRNQLELSI